MQRLNAFLQAYSIYRAQHSTYSLGGAGKTPRNERQERKQPGRHGNQRQHNNTGQSRTIHATPNTAVGHLAR